MNSIGSVVNSFFSAHGNEPSYRPCIWPGSDSNTADRIQHSIQSGLISAVYDTFLEQHLELVETRNPALEAGDTKLRQLAERSLAGTDPLSCGNWVFYPWSGRLVHLLSECDFRELRTSRNRNRITAEEQDKLRRLKIGIVGLSVGMSTAMTLVMEGVGDTFVLADFDHLSLSNLNRVRTGIHNIGLNKAYLTAREIFEINPYANLVIYPEGINDDNLSSFLGLDDDRLGLLIEECDDLYIKIRLREEARLRGIPVLMETTERGMLDIERYDREPQSPLLHGLAEGLNAQELRQLTSAEKVPIILQILGERQLSPRSAASMLEIGTTLRTWPQLASAVSLGAALTTDTARRIALGQLHKSGRYFVDLEAIVADGQAALLDCMPPSTETAEEAKLLPKLPTATRVSEVSADAVRALIAYAIMAPSGGNCQPWRFEYSHRTVHCIHDVARSQSYLDYQNQASYLAFGAAIENFELAAGQMGLSIEVQLFPQASDPTRVCDIKIGNQRAADPDPELFEQIALRVTNRRLGRRIAMAPTHAELLVSAAECRGGRLRLSTDPDQLDAMGELLGRGDRLRFGCRLMHREMMAEVRWTREQVEQTRDGLDIATLEMSPTEVAGMRISARSQVMELITKVGGGGAFEKPSKKAVLAASAIGLVSAANMTPEAFFTAGRSMQRVWLKATALGYAFQPMTAITYLFARLGAGDTGALSAKEVTILEELRGVFLRVFPGVDGEAEGMLFRLSRAEPPTARALRRHVDEVLTIT